MEYKGYEGKVIMMGNKQKAPGFYGELCVVVIQYGPNPNSMMFDVIPDSTDANDQDKLPDIKTFDDKDEAMLYAVQMDRNKRDWKFRKSE